MQFKLTLKRKKSLKRETVVLSTAQSYFAPIFEKISLVPNIFYQISSVFLECVYNFQSFSVSDLFFKSCLANTSEISNSHYNHQNIVVKNHLMPIDLSISVCADYFVCIGILKTNLTHEKRRPKDIIVSS